MGNYLKKFENHIRYDDYINGSDVILPNVSLCVQENEVHYNPYVPPIPVETRVVAKFNVDVTSSPTSIANSISNFTEIEIDGVAQPSVVSAYTFDTIGEHTVMYTLTDPTTIGDGAFYNCRSLTSIDIPSCVTSIGNGAFSECYSITSISIPNSVTSIGNGAFSYCSSLTSIVCNATTAPTIQSTTFQSVKTGGTLTVPSGSTGYDVWMQNAYYYLGFYGWTKVEQ